MTKEYVLRFKTCTMARPGARIERILTTVMVEHGNDDGICWQRPVKYLGRIRERDLDDPLQQGLFWTLVAVSLDEMEIGADERKKIERQIRALIPHPSAYDR